MCTCGVGLLSHSFFFFNDTATTEIYTLSLHDALPISRPSLPAPSNGQRKRGDGRGSSERLRGRSTWTKCLRRSEEHTSELQSHVNLVCRLLLEKKKRKQHTIMNIEEQVYHRHGHNTH